MSSFDDAPRPSRTSPWTSPGAGHPDLTREELMHAAVLEQMAHGATYEGGREDGSVVSHGPDVDVDRQEMLEHNGYEREPTLITGADGLQMVVYRPLPGRRDVAPVVSFRGTEMTELADVHTDTDPEQIGNEQYQANQALIDRTMRQVSARYGQPAEVTGHSLGGSLAQIAAAHNPEATGHITTFQSPGVADEEVERIEAHNRQRAAAGLPPLEATHFRVEGDLVSEAGEGFVPGDVHEMRLAPTLIEPLRTDPYSAHTSHPLTALALDTPGGREALPGIGAPGEHVNRVTSHDVAIDNDSLRPLEFLRQQVGQGLRTTEAVNRLAIAGGQRAVDMGQAGIGRAADAAQSGVDLAQRVAGGAVDRGQAATDRAQETVQGAVDRGQQTVDRGQRGVQGAVDRGQGMIDRAQNAAGGIPRPVHAMVDSGQRALGSGIAAGQHVVDAGQRALGSGVAAGQHALDAGQRVVGGAVSTAQRTVDAGQRAAGGAVNAGQRAIDAGQRTVSRAIASGPQRAVDAGVSAAQAMWHWIAD